MANGYISKQDTVYKTFRKIKVKVEEAKKAEPFNKIWRDQELTAEFVKTQFAKTTLGNIVSFSKHKPTAQQYYDENLNVLTSVFMSSNNCGDMALAWKRWYAYTYLPISDANASKDFEFRKQNRLREEALEREKKNNERRRKERKLERQNRDTTVADNKLRRKVTTPEQRAANARRFRADRIMEDEIFKLYDERGDMNRDEFNALLEKLEADDKIATSSTFGMYSDDTKEKGTGRIPYERLWHYWSETYPAFDGHFPEKEKEYWDKHRHDNRDRAIKAKQERLAREEAAKSQEQRDQEAKARKQFEDNAAKERAMFANHAKKD